MSEDELSWPGSNFRNGTGLGLARLKMGRFRLGQKNGPIQTSTNYPSGN